MNATTELFVQVPMGWFLSAIAVLVSAIAGLASIMWAFMKARLAAQDKIIDLQSSIITNLQADVTRLSAGCGQDTCHWHKR